MVKQDTHLGGAENVNERKPESTTLPNKHPPSGSKKYGTKGEVGFINLAVNVDINQHFNSVTKSVTIHLRVNNNVITIWLLICIINSSYLSFSDRKLKLLTTVNY